MAVIGEEIISMIGDVKGVPIPIGRQSHLYDDLNFDSLSFIRFLVRVEYAYSITIDITQMEACLRVGGLIDLVQEKMRERHRHD